MEASGGSRHHQIYVKTDKEAVGMHEGSGIKLRQRRSDHSEYSIVLHWAEGMKLPVTKALTSLANGAR